jgi:hypothetical protein
MTIRNASLLGRTVLVAAVLVSSARLGAQTTPRLPAGAQPTTRPVATQRPVVTGSISHNGPTLPGTRPPFPQSLLVSLDGLHWGTSATVTYTNSCKYGPPSSCGITPPYTPVHVSWNASIPAAQLALSAANSYYWIEAPVSATCWDPTKIRYVFGDQSTSHATFNGPSPNATQSYTCTYQISARTNQNGTMQTVTTNPVTINVVVTGTQ